jgi:Protein of unknown function (DUF2917)
MNAITKNVSECIETPLTLTANQFVTIKRAQGTCLQCVQGSVWVTLENDPLDFVLSPGERVCIHSPGRMVIEGLEPSEIAIVHTRRHALAHKFVARLGEYFRSALRFIANSHQCPVQYSVDQATTYHGSFRL